MNTGEIVKEILREKGITQVWLAKQIQVSPANLGYMLKNGLKVDQLLQICSVLGITVDDFLAKTKKEVSSQPAKTDNSLPTDKIS